jgi:hypothetical protein
MSIPGPRVRAAAAFRRTWRKLLATFVVAALAFFAGYGLRRPLVRGTDVQLPNLAIGDSTPTFAETGEAIQGRHGAPTFRNPQNASGAGPRVSPRARVSVSCKVYEPTIESVNPDGYWYRISSPPWNDGYYAAANTFMNGDPSTGPYTHNTDYSIPDC